MTEGRVEARASLPGNALPDILEAPWNFLTPTHDLHTIVADSTKRILDPLAASVVHDQSLRRQINKKRRRTADGLESSNPHLQLKSIYVDGFTPHQIWEQATRILEAAAGEVDRDVSLIAMDSYEPSNGKDDISEYTDSVLEESDGLLDESDSVSDDEEPAEVDHSEQDESEDLSDIGMDDEEKESKASEEETGVFIEDRFGLNDGFFSIDDFNKQSEFLERQDAKGEAEDDGDSDEEVNWHANPLEKNTLSQHKPVELVTDGDDADDGPTFGNADLYAPSDDESLEGDVDTPDWVDTSDIKYADFFAPPPRKASSKKHRALPKTQPAKEIHDEDIERAMADVRRDLFDDESDVEDDEAAAENEGPQSTHERRRAQIADEIRRLEAASVAKKEWMLTGEARAVERPVNSLIEEDLDFERVGKPVPVVTNETTEDIEELVKRRILAKEFDEVARRRPGAIDTKPSRGNRFELEDTKPQQSLAELYEADHLKATDPSYSDSKDRKLMRDHAEVTSLWKEISSQLDTLSNWHYKPQAPQASINVVTDAPTVMMEEARPTAGHLGESALAPQEIYAPGDDGKKAGELVLKTGASLSKDEMSREEKARARRQQKKAKKSASASTHKAGAASQLVSDLKKGGVKIVNREGQVTEMDGGKVGTSAKNSADTLKL
ncbi:hypothetical protein N7468_003294 [Penicillium chermesinum]|uniref:U3 small nucleolar ribonucleoprotein protein MPP10 n=1 Tax=Penicillium chermesinum TaxID=63820 RepID=A0A9W9TRG9_9EURO|nr:uncharacterized protein N7468_003294 [Penicillium chermesinum]KAJ5238675.1 hypothetical protein N7468_003294 [Penicillium chermesinum]KAJ6164320.1 hypothetical protein N7470_002992 [Penicillium chermesinum]